MAIIKEPEQLRIVVGGGSDEEPSAALVGAALAAEVAARFGPRDETPLAIGVFDGSALIGGLNGCTHWRWCYIRHLWIEETWRSRGVGRRLLAEAEREARGRGCVGLYLDTFDPGAASFYARCGFRRFGEIAGFPPGHSRIFLCRSLAGASASS